VTLDGVFRSRVISVVRRIPPGRVATYGDVAAAAGSPRASRAVGNIMRTCRLTGVPCHRVIAAGGRLGGYGGNLQLKRELLRAEGIIVTGSRVKEFTTRRWTRPTRTSRALPSKRPRNKAT
jgi:O-6-methylguanine DNA methyltransferase